MSAARMRVEEELRHAEDLAMCSKGDAADLLRELVDVIACAINRRVSAGKWLPPSEKYLRDKRRHEQPEVRP